MAEYTRRPSLPDVRQELPAPPVVDFIEEITFERVERTVESLASAEDAYRDGLSEGEQRGREAALKEMEPVLEELRALSASIADVRARRIEAAEADLLEVATEVARRVLRGELEQSEDVVLRMAKACIEEAKSEGALVLHVSPDDLERVRAHLPDLEAELAEGEIRLESDPAIARGCVVLETPRGCYDGRPDRILNDARLRAEVEGLSK